jgi:hypothetical protein
MSIQKSIEEIVEELKNDWVDSSGVSVIEFIELFVGRKISQLLQSERDRVEEDKEYDMFHLRQEVKSLEQSVMNEMDKYQSLAKALGFEGDAWFGDPLASHQEILAKAQALTNPQDK